MAAAPHGRASPRLRGRPRGARAGRRAGRSAAATATRRPRPGRFRAATQQRAAPAAARAQPGNEQGAGHPRPGPRVGPARPLPPPAAPVSARAPLSPPPRQLRPAAARKARGAHGWAPLMPPPARRPPRPRPRQPGLRRPATRPGAPHWSAPPWTRPGWPRRRRRTPTPRTARGTHPTGRPRPSRPPTACRTSTRWPPSVSATRGDTRAGAPGAARDAGSDKGPWAVARRLQGGPCRVPGAGPALHPQLPGHPQASREPALRPREIPALPPSRLSPQRQFIQTPPR